MKWLLILVILFGAVDAAPAAEESLGKKIKKILAPTPTPSPARKHRKHSTKKPTPRHRQLLRLGKKASPSPTPTEQIKAQENVSYSNTGANRHRQRRLRPRRPEESRRSWSRKKRLAERESFAGSIEGYESNPPRVRQILDAGLALTKQNLGYTYGSADPANGGMDCSGFIYYLLKQNGFPDVPRDSSQQYVWVRKAGNFYAVLSRKEDSFEFDDLKPGDLLFWRGTYNIDRDPPITHTMIYLGREKRTNKRVMIGSSDGRTYDGKQRWGVSVFDFKMPPPPKSGDAKISPVFVGYGRIPGLSEN